MAWHNVTTDFTTASTSSPRVEYSLRGIRRILDMKSANTAVGKEELRSHLDVIGAISAISLDLVASAGKSPSNRGHNVGRSCFRISQIPIPRS